MKKFQLCGFGNGLVDLQCKISSEEFDKFNLKKGDMLLVDETTQELMLEKLIGKNLISCSGGSAANSIIAFSQLGGSAAYQTVLGNDDYGKFYSSEFTELGIRINAPMLDSHRTGTCVVLITEDGERTMHTNLAATALFEPKYLDIEAITSSEYLFIEGYELANTASTNAIFEAIKIAKANGTKIAFTISAEFIIDIFKEQIDKILVDTDILFCNDTEAMKYTGKINADEAFDALCSIVPCPIVTLGPKGAIYRIDNKSYSVPAYFSNRIDTTGAGDMFAGAFMYGVINHNPIYAGHLASYCAGLIVGQYGARLNGDMTIIKKDFERDVLPKLEII